MINSTFPLRLRTRIKFIFSILLVSSSQLPIFSVKGSSTIYHTLGGKRGAGIIDNNIDNKDSYHNNIPFLKPRRHTLEPVSFLTSKRLPLLSKIRGGSMNRSTTATVNTSTKRYARIGLIDLSSSSLTTATKKNNGSKNQEIIVSTHNANNHDNGSIIFRDALQKWIHSRNCYYHNDIDGIDDTDDIHYSMEIGTIYAIHSSSKVRYEYKIDCKLDSEEEWNSNKSTNNQQKDTGNIVETIGCLVDSVIVAYDGQLKYRQNAIIRLLKGIQRQQRSTNKKDSKGSSAGNSRNIDLIFLANSNEAHVELEAIRDIIMSDDNTSIQSIQIVPVYNVNINNDDEFDKYIDAIVDEIHCFDSGSGRRIAESPVQINSFIKLIQSVHFKLSGKKNCVEENVNVCNIIETETEVQAPTPSIGHTSSTENEGSIIDDDKEDNMEIIDDVTNDVQDHPEEHHSSIEMDSVDEYTSSEVEDDEIMNLDGAHVTSETFVVHPHIDEIEDEVPSPSLTTPVDVKSSSRILEEILVKKSNDITQQAEKQMDELEMKQDEVLLEIEKTMPILQFGSEAGNILKQVSCSFDDGDVLSSIKNMADSDIVETKRNEIFAIVEERIHSLFESQLQALREYYGRRYENLLNGLEEKYNIDMDSMDEQEVKERREKLNTELADAAKQSTEGFRVAARNAIPQVLKEGKFKEFGSKYVFDAVLDGLIRDMMHATSSVQAIEEEWASANDDSDGVDTNDEFGGIQRRRRGPVKWYEKLAARALVIGVNYIQGWLALQGIRKAASERDKLMPKFPMF